MKKKIVALLLCGSLAFQTVSISAAELTDNSEVYFEEEQEEFLGEEIQEETEELEDSSHILFEDESEVQTEESEEIVENEQIDELQDFLNEDFTDGRNEDAFQSGETKAELESGRLNDNINWVLYDNGELVIQGIGGMPNFSNDSMSNNNIETDAPWFRQRQYIKKVKIADGITSVGLYSFANCDYLTEVIIADSVVSIGDCVFSDCSSLKNILIPEGVTRIGVAAFSNCTSLESIIIPNSVTEIGSPDFWGAGSTFADCDSLKKIVLSQALSNIAESTFQGCSALTEIEIPDSVTGIGSNAFQDCISLASVRISKSVTYMGERVFSHCRKLKSITIPESLRSCGYYSFEYCSRLEEVSLPDNMIGINDGLFFGCSGLKKIVLPSGIKNIGQSAFQGCRKLQDIDIPKKVMYIEREAFKNCESLIKVVISNSVTDIGESAFSGCKKLINITIPQKIREIKPQTFFNCKSLSDIVILEGTIGIGESAFDGCSGLRSVIIPKSLIYIDDNAFEWDSELIVRYCGSEQEWENLNVVGVNADRIYYNYDPNHIHKYRTEEIKSPTCIDTGEKLYICILCGEKYSEEIPAIDHTWDEGKITKKPTCTEAGEKVFTCTVCKEKKTEEIEQKGHNWNEAPSVDKKPTCTESGKESIHCGTCNAVKEGSEKEIPAIGHTWDEGKITKKPTCTEAGEKVFTCTVCKEKKTEEIEQKGHNWNEAPSVDKKPTCTEPGKESIHCGTCNAIKEDSEKEIPAIGHKEILDKAVKPTCIESGLTEGKHCSVCGEILKIQEKVPATGHKYGEWKILNKATIFVPEKRIHSCKVCKYKETQNVGEKLKPTIKYTTTKLPLKIGQKVTSFRVYGLANGDYVKSWRSTNTRIVKVSGRSNGTCNIIAGKSAGKAYISITLRSGLRRNITVLVQKSSIRTTSISGVEKKKTLRKGQNMTLRPEILPISSVEKVTYSSSNRKVASVNSRGVVKALNPGTAKITVKSGNKRAVCIVRVLGISTQSIQNVKKSLALKSGQSYTLRPVLTPRNSTDKITYSSSNNKIVIVSSKGKIMAKKKGIAVVTVKSGKKAVKCKITVK